MSDSPPAYTMSYSISDLPTVLIDALRTKRTYDIDGKQIDLGSNVSPEEALLLYEAVRELRPARSLEVGFASGVSAAAILKGIADNGAGEHHVMDPFQSGYGDSGIAMVERAGLSRWMHFHRAFAEEVIPDLGLVDFAFIDASHLFDLTLVEFVLADKKLRVGGVVGFHDMWMPAQQAVIRFILSNRRYEVWQPGGRSTPSPRRDGWKNIVRGICARMPRADKIFTPDFLTPWKAMNLPNLVLLRKTANDDRRWAHFSRF